MLINEHINNGKFMSQQKPYPLRMPDDVRERLQSCADESGRSLNAEIIYRLQRTLDEDAELADGDGAVYLDGLNEKPRDLAGSYAVFSGDDLTELARALLKEVMEREAKVNSVKDEEK